jgi:hypothetical protein
LPSRVINDREVGFVLDEQRGEAAQQDGGRAR